MNVLTRGYQIASMMILEQSLQDLRSEKESTRNDAAEFFERDREHGWMCDLCCIVAGLDADKIRARAKEMAG